MTSKALPIPAELAPLFKRPPLLVSEDPAQYEALFRALAETIRPNDNLEWIGTARYVDLVWEAKRLRGAKAAIINTTFREALGNVLEALLPDTDDRAQIATRLVEEWHEKPQERGTVIALLAKHGLEPDAVCAEALALRAGELEKLDRALHQLEISSMAQLREIEFHRRASSWRAPQRLNEIIANSGDAIQLPKPEDALPVGPHAMISRKARRRESEWARENGRGPERGNHTNRAYRMTTERQIAANRRNAQHSRGPRAPGASRRASRNALRHGLAVSVLKDSAIAGEIERLAQVFAGTGENGPLLAQARAIIEAEFDLRRIAQRKASLLNLQLVALTPAGSSALATRAELNAQQPIPIKASAIGFADAENAIGPAMINVLPQLMKLLRYESRARSRQARAFRLFAAHKAVGVAWR